MIRKVTKGWFLKNVKSFQNLCMNLRDLCPYPVLSSSFWGECDRDVVNLACYVACCIFRVQLAISNSSVTKIIIDLVSFIYHCDSTVSSIYKCISRADKLLLNRNIHTIIRLHLRDAKIILICFIFSKIEDWIRFKFNQMVVISIKVKRSYTAKHKTLSFCLGFYYF